MFRRFILLVAILAITVPGGRVLYAQQPKKCVKACRIKTPVVIDGKLNEPVWDSAEKASGFTQLSPRPGAGSALPTEVSIFYDDNAVYIGAMLYDNHPDSILKQLTGRDDFEYANTDAFGVAFDTYGDQQNGFAFFVTAGGVQADAKIRFDGFDYSWNAAWFSKARISDKGWAVEMKIPYSALRFPKSAVQNWGVNFTRTIRRTREKSYWSTITPGVSNYFSQAGELHDVHDILSPIRLAFLPYLSAYGQNFDGSYSKTINGGLDIKYGINESFTLDLTLVPDFGQTLYDNKVLNLSPVEVRYDERRYFFTEGIDLFNKNDLFYSRRVGGSPINSGRLNSSIDSTELVIQNPATTKLYNATKISGRTKGNLGIGFFNAVAAPAYATVRDTINGRERKLETAPLTNYNVIVLDQALKHNSYISFINTNVLRKENSYNANVSALLFRFCNKSNSYAISGSSDVSDISGGNAKADIGYRYYLALGKIKGNYLATFSTQTISDRFNPNDLGYLGRNNLSYYALNQSYNIYKPFWIANSASSSFNISYNKIFNPDAFYSFNINGSENMTFKNFLSSSLYWDTKPFSTSDYFEPRTPGRFYLYPRYFNIGGYVSSDYRKKFACDAELNHSSFAEPGRNSTYIFLSPRYRFSDKFSMVYRVENTASKNEVGFVNNVNGDIYLGTRDVNTFVNALTGAYIFNNRMSLSLDARHYWSQAKYSKYSLLNMDGTLSPSAYNTNHNINFNSFNIYTSFVWQFKPGSEMSIVYQNSIYSSGQMIEHNYFNNLNQTLAAAQSNSLSIKVIYYLDYLTLKSSLKKV